MEHKITHLSKKERFLYLLGAVPLTFMAGIFGLLYVDYFKNIIGLEQKWFITGQIIYALVNAFNDPLLGQMTDRTDAKKWGSRRLIYIKWGGLIWGLVFFGMWFPWSYEVQWVIFLHYTLSICAFDMCLTLVILCWMALLPELTEDLHERNRIQFSVGIFGSVAAVLVLLAQWLIHIENGLFYFQIVAGICGALSVIIYLIMGSKLKERPELYQFEPIPPLFTSIKETLKSKAFTSYTGYKFFNFVNSGMGFSFMFAFLYIFGENPADPLLLVYYFLITTPISWISQAVFMRMVKNGKSMKKLIQVGRTIGLLINVVAFFLMTGLTVFKGQFGMNGPLGVGISLPLIALKTVFGGFGLFGYPMLMLAIDEDEVKHGTRREGMFLGVNAFFIKFADSVGPILATTLLYNVFGFVDELVLQSDFTMFGIVLVFYLIPAVFELAGLISISFYPLDGLRLAAMRVDLAELHEEKAAKFSEVIMKEK